MPRLLLLLLSFSLNAFGQGNPSGIYSGSMHLTDGGERDIPLQISLALTGETQQVGGTVQQVIDGAFLVDDEGGPFGFSRVRFDIFANTVELTYSRPQAGNINTSPSYQLRGSFRGNDTVTGTVYSGAAGNIGTFAVTRTNWQGLKVTRKYQGAWRGSAIYLPENVTHEFQLLLGDSLRPSVNPPNSELEYTRGKSASFNIDGLQDALHSVYIDYFRRKAVLMTVNQSMVMMMFEVQFTPDLSQATGDFSSVMRGRRGTFTSIKAP